MKNNLTALTSLFARTYHSTYSYKIYNDVYASKIITKEEYIKISNDISNGIKFFNPNFNGTKDDALRYIVDKYLSPTVLTRTRYNLDILKNEIRLGCKQYLNIASGYDTTGYIINKYINVFELDKHNIINDKINRIHNSNINNENITYISCNLKNNWIERLLYTNYNKDIKTHCSLLGISYYLTKNELATLIHDLSTILCQGSSIIFDYPTYSNNNIITELLTTGANEEIKSKYSTTDITTILENNNLLVYENLTYKDIDQKYFYDYNTLNPNHKLNAQQNVNICLAVKKNYK